MGNTASGCVNSNVPGYMANTNHNFGDQNLTPVPVIVPVPGIPTADQSSPANTTGQAIRHAVFHETPSDDYMTTEFLKRCFTCKREFRPRVDIFMYKDLSFCSDDCRNKEMEKDTDEEMTDDDDKMLDDVSENGKTAPERPIFFIGMPDSDLINGGCDQ